jgi:cbb3-type cytochrome oxidase maturation FixS-like protein
MRRIRIAKSMIAIFLVAWALLVTATPVLAHEQPDGAEWLMADWMLLSFMVFGGAALAVFLVALKRGQFHNMEAAKYHILSIEEPDYYTPEWARNRAQEDPDADRQ